MSVSSNSEVEQLKFVEIHLYGAADQPVSRSEGEVRRGRPSSAPLPNVRLTEVLRYVEL